MVEHSILLHLRVLLGTSHEFDAPNGTFRFEDSKSIAETKAYILADAGDLFVLVKTKQLETMATELLYSVGLWMAWMPLMEWQRPRSDA